jgi:hypothetical protein
MPLPMHLEHVGNFLLQRTFPFAQNVHDRERDMGSAFLVLQ